MKRSIDGDDVITPPIAGPTLRERIMGCWLGKAVGGTLGQTFEGLTGPLEADFYHPVPTGMVPNDDLDLQVVYAVVMAAETSPAVDRRTIARAWRDHVSFPWNEYGVGKRNSAEGIEPPHTGSFDNWYTCGEGAVIRAELWACLAAGNPDLAGLYAQEDACFDHAGDGVNAAVFMARLQALAFVETDPDILLDAALAGIDPASGIHAVVQDTRRWVADGLTWHEVRDLIVAKYANSDFTDVRPNTGFVITGWLSGTTFAERVCITNNCGLDTDSTTASLGSLLGILDPTSIPEKWLAPIGRDLVLSPEIHDLPGVPETLEEFTDLVVDLRERIGGRPPMVPVAPFDPAAYRIPVRIGRLSTNWETWTGRDLTGLPPAGAPLPEVPMEPASLTGTWVRMPRAAFRAPIILVSYTLHTRGRDRVRIMVNSSEAYRCWIDGTYAHGAQGSEYMFPAPHMAPLGQSFVLDLPDGEHDLTLAVRRPDARIEAEWVLAVVEDDTSQWIPHALRPDVQLREGQVSPALRSDTPTPTPVPTSSVKEER